MSKRIINSKNNYDAILEAVDIITEPVAQTISPKGGNVLYENSVGVNTYTNDGATIVKQISVKDPEINQIIQVIKESSLKTNIEAGDGTSSTIILSSVLIKEGVKLLRMGWNTSDIQKELIKISKDIIDNSEKFSSKINGDKDIHYIANVSASNDSEIAENTVKTINVVGKDGQVIINPGYNSETEIIEDTGFIISSGLLFKELALGKTFQANYENVLTLVTDKKLYYEKEAEIILKTALSNGYKSVVIVASDFVGEALPLFIENHIKGVINVMLVKVTEPEIIDDIAVYLNTEVISDRSGSLDNLSIEHFTISKMVFSDMNKTIISRDSSEPSKLLNIRINEIKKELKKIGDKKSSEYRSFEKRLASLTRGMVTIKVGGSTPIEINEKIYRYEDAINATRAALDDGYIPGGGITLMNSWSSLKKEKYNQDMVRLFNVYSESIIRQVLRNCGEKEDVILEKIKSSKFKNTGYNAVTNTISDMIKDGVIEPRKVLVQSILNSVSIAIAILTSNYRIVNELEEDKKDK